MSDWAGATTGTQCGDLGPHEPNDDCSACERCGDHRLAATVPRLRTPIPLSLLRDSLSDAFTDAVVSTPDESTVAIAWAQNCLEAGVRGDLAVSIFNNAIGNIDATREQQATEPTFITVGECELDKAGHEYHVTHVRLAHDTPEEGAAAYWVRLRTAWPEAFGVATGDPATADDVAAGRDLSARFAHALAHPRDGGAYFTDHESTYAAGVRRWLTEYWRRWPMADGQAAQ